jgi:SAM-dependent methyltransferase
MASVEEHYDRHLGPIYSWMQGGAVVAVEIARSELHEWGIGAGLTGVAVDLGAGTGAHSIALAELGFSVIALDTCAELLDELKRNAGSHAISPVLADLGSFPEHCTAPVDVILCMGDTLTHLPSLAAVKELFQKVRAQLSPGGRFLATFRDYVGAELEGVSRFIPVRSDEKRILTCFLEYRQQQVMVYDLLQVYGESGWTMTASCYPKLRIDPVWARDVLAGLGLDATLERGARGMVRLTGTLSIRSAER